MPAPRSSDSCKALWRQAFPDMMQDETLFERALRQVRENKAHIARQCELIGLLEQSRQSHLLPDARRALATLQSKQRLFSDQLRRVFDRDP
jgi:hypothetical protein